MKKQRPTRKPAPVRHMVSVEAGSDSRTFSHFYDRPLWVYVNDDCVFDSETGIDDVRGLTVHHRPDGCVMRFRASAGQVALINLDTYAQGRAPGARKAIEQWIEEGRPNAGLHRQEEAK